MLKKIMFLLSLFLLLSSISFALEGEVENNKLIFFYSDTCPHCHEEALFLDELEVNYPDLIVERYEVSQPGVVDKLMALAEQYDFKPRGVPVTFIKSDYFIGYDSDETTGKEIEDAISKCLLDDPICTTTDKNKVTLPFFGEMDVSNLSLPLFTIVIGGLDGFNPCAMWVLMFLLSILIYAKSRKKMLLIGGIFVVASALIYFLFMTAWLNFFLLVGFIPLMRLIIAAVAIIFGLINIKELFWFKKGVSLTIDDKHKPKLFEKMRKIVHEQRTSIAIFGTITLAIFVNFIELLCTAGLPAIYTNILVSSNLSTFGYYAYLALYNIIYVIPLIVILLVFVITMGRHKFTEKQGKILKLVSGLLMLVLGLIMVFAPELLNFT